MHGFHFIGVSLFKRAVLWRKVCEENSICCLLQSYWNVFNLIMRMEFHVSYDCCSLHQVPTEFVLKQKPDYIIFYVRSHKRRNAII